MALTIRGVSPGWNSTTLNAMGITPSGSEVAGDRIIAFAAWKDFAVTATFGSTQVASWTELTEFADGSVGTGNGVGSMKVAAWYTDWIAGDTTLNAAFSGNVLAAGLAITLAKDASDTWDTPLFATAAWPLGGSSAQTVAASSSIAIPDGGIVTAIIGIRDDSATFTRGATTGIDVASGITWNGNYVEDPATHRSTTNGDDGSYDFGYRLVTTGGTVAPRVTATLSANETGSVLWVVQGVTAAAAERVPKFSSYPQLLAH